MSTKRNTCKAIAGDIALVGIVCASVLLMFAGCKHGTAQGNVTVCKDGVCLTYDPTNGTSLSVVQQIEK